mgnify:CR=1 FL=1
MNPRAKSVVYQGNFQLLVTFANDEVKKLDLKEYLKFPIYEPLREEAFCKTVRAVDGVLQWDDFIDLDPDTAYLESTPVELVSK